MVNKCVNELAQTVIGARLSRQTHPKDPAVLKTLRDSELLRHSVFIAPPIFNTL